MPHKPPPATAHQRKALIGAAIHFKRMGAGKIVGWSGHVESWPLVRLDRDPPYFGPLLCDDSDSMRAAMVAAGLKVEARS